MRRMITLIACVPVLALAAFALLALWPMPRHGLILRVHPAANYDDARARAAKWLANPPPEVRPECRATILDHGRRTRDAYVLLHGLTNCPLQFRKFADQLFERGANVLLPRLPHHGLADRMTAGHAQLTAQELIDSAGEAIDLARGYGDRVIVVGLSVSGVSAAWLAQQRGDIDLAVAIAPFLAPAHVPGFAVRPLANLSLRLPNTFLWWDSQKKENLSGSEVVYPRFSTHAIGETMRLGLDLFALARKSPPSARKILLVTSPADTAISLGRTGSLDALWKGRAEWRAFPAEWRIPHDCIDPAQPDAQTDLVYPQLREWIDSALAD